MVEHPGHHPGHVIHQTAHMSALAITAVCMGVMVAIAAVSAIAYKCYRRRVMQNAQNRLSSAIKKGLKESSSGKRPSRGSTVMKVTKATSPISPPEHPSGPSEKLSPGSFSIHSDNIDSPRHVVKQEVVVEYEKGGETPEKEMVEKLKEMQFTESSDKPQYLGSLNFAVEFDPDKAALLVTIISLSDLPPRDPSLGGCDPYIKLQLLPEKKHKCKTRVLRKTLNPVYDETFTFYGISFNQLQGITLHFVLLSFDRFSRDAIIGEVLYPLDPEEICQKQLTMSREVTPRHLRADDNETFKVSKGAKIRSRYNQVPHLTQDTNGKVTNSQLDTTNESQEVSPFPAGDHKAHINRRAQRHGKHETEQKTQDPQKKYRLGTFRTQGCGEILVSLCYQPAANRLTVVVLKARNLPKMDITGLSGEYVTTTQLADPYVKIYLLYNNQRIAKKKTHVKKRTLNPVFNESFLFDVPYNEGLQNISLEFLVLDWDRMTKNEVVGRLEIGARTRGPQQHHWNEVMNCPRKQIAEWHKLTD